MLRLGWGFDNSQVTIIIQLNIHQDTIIIQLDIHKDTISIQLHVQPGYDHYTAIQIARIQSLSS